MSIDIAVYYEEVISKLGSNKRSNIGADNAVVAAKLLHPVTWIYVSHQAYPQGGVPVIPHTPYRWRADTEISVEFDSCDSVLLKDPNISNKIRYLDSS